MINKIKKIFGLSVILLSAVLFSSCFDPIFFEIRNDIEPEDATVSGIIQQIVRFNPGTSEDTEYIVTFADGGLRYKKYDDQNHGNWTTVSLPFPPASYNFDKGYFIGEYPIAIAADKDNLYLASIKIESDYEGYNTAAEINIRSTTSINGSWTTVWSVDRGSSFIYYTDGYSTIKFNMFCTNAAQKANRKAYFREGESKLYELSGSSKTELTTNNTCLDSGSAKNWNSAAYFGSQVFFFESCASETNETKDTAATKLYFSDGKKLYYSSAATPTPAEGETELTKSSFEFKSDNETNYKIRSIAVFTDRLLLSKGDIYEGYGGVSAISLNSDGNPSSSDFVTSSTHANTKFAPNYIVPVIFNATPGKTESNSIIYGSTGIATNGTAVNVSYKDVGLFAYYPNRGNWNRE